MLDNLAVSTSHPQSRWTNNNLEMSQFYVHFSGPGSSCSLWTGPTPPPSSQSCATMFSATGYRIALSRFPGKPFPFALSKLPEKSLVSNCVLSRYATRSLYGYCPQWALNWEYRFNQMETRSGNSSFIPPLQEERHFGWSAPLCSWHHCHAGGGDCYSNHCLDQI